MKKLVQNLYDDDLPENEKVDFGEMLTIGSFDDGADEEYRPERQETWNGYVINYEDGSGF